MAGHSKWAKLKHTKAKTDAQRAKLFSKLVRFISVEAKKAKGDRTSPCVRTAIEKARTANMPTENIERALDKALGEGAETEHVVYEAYGPGGAALVIEGYTDNRNRTSAEIKHLLNEHGGALASPNAAMWAFTRLPAQAGTEGKLESTATVELSDQDLEKLVTLVEILEEHDDVSDVYTNAA